MAVVRTIARALLLILVCLLAVVSSLQIPNHLATTHANSTPDRYRQRPRPAIVIDLGNTNSCVAGYEPGKPETVFQHCIPSWVAFTDDGAALVGEAAKNYAGAHHEAAVSGFKRLLGLRLNHEFEEAVVQRLSERVPYKIGARDFVWPVAEVKAMDGEVRQLYIEEIASMVVAELKKKAEDHLGRTVRDAVVTVPGHFNDPSTWAAMDAGKMAGLDVVRTVSEQFAAAVAYGLHVDGKLRENGNVLVLHVGGGTADASVVTRMDGSLEILADANDPFLGGDDFDQGIVDYFVKLIKTKHGNDISEDRIALGKLRTACERAKKALSSQDRAQVSIESLFGGVDFTESISRQMFEELNDDLFGKVIALVEKAMVQAELEMGTIKIDEIVLVGGSTMIPKIQRLVRDYFGGKELNVVVKPDEAVAHGAAVHVQSSDN
ncbi:hypothetical protein HU200_059742 [Digitaria exilis]|uniref:Heat shock protein 70 n=1 Tax=Digitaria exilis TaxID=1010633 RepID=A0A835A7T3_9POAL|nr:hypothetical protein HU200_059739 [Digitaria exilis]KAF8657932.1 hypothetical protein HU200_059742 [Digitaria exilis]CAB3459407.1 unnamed protein product [Digitaria exilis]CAB3459409.1 unnamed protein product [Digitaria exilis]